MMYDILFVITRGDDIGGANIHVRDLSIWLDKKGLKVAVLTGKKGIFNKILNENNIDNYFCPNLEREINIFDIYFIFWFWRFSKKVNPKLIFVTHLKLESFVDFQHIYLVLRLVYSQLMVGHLQMVLTFFRELSIYF